MGQASPVAIHFGALDTRLLQLQKGARNWSVRMARTFSARGRNRHFQVAEEIKKNLKGLKSRGKDAVLATAGADVAVALIPVDATQRGRIRDTLEEAAQAAVQDEEGVVYRYLPLSTYTERSRILEECLLLSTGASEIRRCTTAAEALGFRPAGMEMNAFAIARALQAGRDGSGPAWGFLHLGFDRSLLGIFHEGEVRFLKPLQVKGNDFLETLQHTLKGSGDGGDPASFSPEVMNLLGTAGSSPDPSEEPAQEDDQPATALDQAYIASLGDQAVKRAVEILTALRNESEALAQEVRACLRHFASRSKGTRVEEIVLGGFGAALPEVEKAVARSLSIPTRMARPFTDLGIKAPEELLAEEHLWTTAVGLAIRGFR
ncbi:MAG: pilus assembly protein PilM [Planctomycetota bacterium]